MDEQLYRTAAIPRNPEALPWVRVAPGGRYFMTEEGAPFLVIGQNDAPPWVNMHNLHYEQDIATTEGYVRMLAEHGVTVMRVMLEYAHDRFWFLENPVGRFVPEQVLYWDDMLGLCERYGVRLLVSPWDTFFMSRRWKHHPYGKRSSPFRSPGDFCIHPPAIEAQKRRWEFIVDRWGNSGAIFGYDLLNEIHPYWGGTPEQQHGYIAEMAQFVKQREMERYGKRHLLTCSIFGPFPDEGYAELIFRHPELDFASTHIYWYGAIDKPDNTFDCVDAVSQSVKHALKEIKDHRPYTDGESGPIHLFIDHHRQLDEAFDDEYYHNMSWAHLASGGAGSGLRWPYRDPHCLTPGMHDAQLAMSKVCKAIDWAHFTAENIDERLRVVSAADVDAYEGELEALPALEVRPVGLSDGLRALIWVVRDTRHTSVEQSLPEPQLLVAGWRAGTFCADFWDTYRGELVGSLPLTVGERVAAEPVPLLRVPLPLTGKDLAVIIRPLG